jgi:hypothetical protein
MPEAITVGSSAPDFTYATAEGSRARLSQLWQDRPALVLWLRHFG